MGNQSYWTEERRQAQRDRINRVKPWLKSTGAKTPEGKAISSQNAYTTGVAEYRRDMASMNAEIKAFKKDDQDSLDRLKKLLREMDKKFLKKP
jgi:hypothetical protein